MSSGNTIDKLLTAATTRDAQTSHGLGFTMGEGYEWVNPHRIRIPVIKFESDCKKCHGEGTCTSRISGTLLPCTRCYKRQGYCKKCYGTGINYRLGSICTKCHTGKRKAKQQKKTI